MYRDAYTYGRVISWVGRWRALKAGSFTYSNSATKLLQNLIIVLRVLIFGHDLVGNDFCGGYQKYSCESALMQASIIRTWPWVLRLPGCIVTPPQLSTSLSLSQEARTTEAIHCIQHIPVIPGGSSPTVWSPHGSSQLCSHFSS